MIDVKKFVMMKIIDTHAHLDQLEHVEEALVRAYQEGVEAVVAVGIDAVSSRKNLELSERREKNWPKIYLAFGMHPSEADREVLKECIGLISHNITHLKAIGEIGLDFWQKEVKKDPRKKAEQEEVFKKQLALAKEFSLPVSIHSRGSWQRCFELLLASGVKKAVFHWYSGSLDILKEILNQGFFISATPALKYSPQHQEAVKFAPIEKLFLETDSPVFYGERETGFRAEPQDVFKTLPLVSQIKDISEEAVARITTDNAKKFFNF